MFGQTFEFADLAKVGLLILLEALLSADNALILAIIVRHLPKDQQKKALFYGLMGAFILRLAAILIASKIAAFWWLQTIGALYLLYLPIKHFVRHSSNKEVKVAVTAGFWMTVAQAELTDLAFAIDSILVAVAIEPHPNKVWVIYLGAIIGIVLLRWAASAFLRLLEKYPVLDHVAYLLVGWAGVKLTFLAGHTYGEHYKATHGGATPPIVIGTMSPLIFWAGLLLIVGIGAFIAFRNPAPTEDEENMDEAADQIDEALPQPKQLIEEHDSGVPTPEKPPYVD